MELAVAILSSAGVSAALTGTIVFLFKTTIAERIKNAIKSEYDLKLEAFKHELSVASQKEIESLKAQLQIAAITHQIQYSTLHEKITETIAGVYARIVKLRGAVENYVKVMESVEEPDKKERRKIVGECFGEFQDYYQPNKIYLPKGVIPKVEELEKLLFETAYDFMWKVERPGRTDGGHDSVEAWGEAHRAIAERLPPILAALEDEFRARLGHAVE